MQVVFKKPPVQIYEKHWHSPKVQLARKKKTVVFWTDKEIDELIGLYNSGKTYEQIAKILKRTTAAVASKLAIMLRDQTLWVLKA